MKKWKTIIKPKYRLLEYDYRELWNYRDLCWMFVKKNYITRYKQTVFGPLYLILSPLLTSGVYSIIFGTVAGIQTNGIPNFLFYMISNLAWGYFAGCMGSNKDVFSSNAYIMGKVYFPRLVLPLSNIITSLIHFCAQALVFLVFYMGFLAAGLDTSPNPAVLLVPVLMLELGLMGLSLGLIVSSLSIRYRDLNVIIGYLMGLLMYATPVLYPMKNLNPLLYRLMLANPLAAPLELLRYAFFGIGSVEIGSLTYSFLFTGCVSLTAMVLFNRVEKTFVDTI